MSSQGNKCTLCPRECGIDRAKAMGVCGVGNTIKIAKVMLHHWEEPSISGKNGSGAIFFSGCPLKCVYCQNMDISHEAYGKEASTKELADIMLDLQGKGAHNINLVTPTHYSAQILEALNLAKSELKIPVVYNTSGYEKPEIIKKIAEYVSVFLVDIKYFSPELSKKYSKAENYYENARASLGAMLEARPKCVFDKNGIMTSGVIVRHLVLPSCRHDSMAILEDIAKNFDVSTFKLSLMSQYTPDFCPSDFKELKRRVTSFEYQSVVDYAISLGYDGYIQDKSSATSAYTPDFKHNS
ncbi:MAG: radical SAM protein [Clostridia bacterium]|nr:radical SAM protein [Clostridia bacterium]